MRISITGTPGTGKTTVAKLLSKKLNIPFFTLSEIIKQEKLYTTYDVERDAYIPEIDRLVDFFSNKESFIAEGLIAHYIPSDLTVILRVKPSKIRERLKERNYKKEKIEENVEAEKIAFCANEVFENPNSERIIQIDTTDKTPEEVVSIIIEAVKGKDVFDDVDWLEAEGEWGM